ncbi:hypothetical protein AMTR_s00056p00132720 [Amborella trichopoda]|uniref:Uncharacterized protein n=1 Tax=Amborella trichopoda TaxID=13333 RepID=U5D479_AMBTC|nr:hypothetical protein AMTR_s00056p00132720 [Amborella trichopoda]
MTLKGKGGNVVTLQPIDDTHHGMCYSTNHHLGGFQKLQKYLILETNKNRRSRRLYKERMRNKTLRTLHSQPIIPRISSNPWRDGVHQTRTPEEARPSQLEEVTKEPQLRRSSRVRRAILNYVDVALA